MAQQKNYQFNIFSSLVEWPQKPKETINLSKWVNKSCKKQLIILIMLRDVISLIWRFLNTFINCLKLHCVCSYFKFYFWLLDTKMLQLLGHKLNKYVRTKRKRYLSLYPKERGEVCVEPIKDFSLVPLPCSCKFEK